MTAFENESAMQAIIEEEEARRISLLDNLIAVLEQDMHIFDRDMITFDELMYMSTKEIGEYISGLLDFHHHK